MNENDFSTVQEAQVQELQTVTNEQNPITNTTQQQIVPDNLKFCKFCGSKIPMDAVLCVHCGRQVEELKQAQMPNITINNANTNTNANINGGFGVPRNKWVAFFLCLFLGWLGAHKFYEYKPIMGILYLFTLGGFGIGWLLDTIIHLFKPNPYYV